MTAADRLTVHAAIAVVMGRMPAIPKGDKAPGSMGGFSYRGIEAITTTLQPILASVGLVIIPQAQTISIDPSPGQKQAWQDVLIKFDWLIIGPDGSTVTASTFGIGRDHTDKGSNKAQSQAYKYLLMGLFMISDSAADGDGHDYSGSEQPDPVDPVLDARVHAVMDELAAAPPEAVAVFKGWKGDRKATIPALIADIGWLVQVESWLDENLTPVQETAPPTKEEPS